LQELASRRSVVVEIADLDRRPRRLRRWLDRPDTSAFGANREGAVGSRRAARQADARDRSDARERLSPESQRLHCLPVVEGGDLARCVTRERHRQIVLGDATAVVDDADLLDAPFSERDADLGRCRVQAVLEELLEHRGGAVDNLARRDLADQRIGQQAYGGHGFDPGLKTRATRQLYVARENAAGGSAPFPLGLPVFPPPHPPPLAPPYH